jgi:hypothetical protein
LKYLKYMAVVLLILAVLAAAFHLYRESIVRAFANSVLSEQNIAITEIAIDSLRTDYVHLSYLVLEQDNGTRLQISGLSFPLNYSAGGHNRITADEFELVPPGTAQQPPALADILRTFLQMPDLVRNSEIAVSSVRLPGVPLINDFLWKTASDGQQLSFAIEQAHVGLIVDSPVSGEHKAHVTVGIDDTRDAASLALSIADSVGGLSVDGSTAIKLTAWLTTLKSVGMLPGSIQSLSADLDGHVTLALYDDALQPVTVTAELSLPGEFSADYRVADGFLVHAQARSAEQIRLHINYPAFDWSAEIGEVYARVQINDNDELPLHLSGLTCRAGILCTTKSSLETGPLQFGGTTIANLKLAATLALAMSDSTRISVAPDLSLTMTGIDAPGYMASSVQLMQTSGAQLEIDDTGWRGDIERLELLFETLSDRQSLTATVPVTLDTLQFRDSGTTVTTNMFVQPATAALTWNDIGVVAPGAKGNVSFREQQVAALLSVTDDTGSLAAQLDVSYDLASDSGSILVHGAELDFEQAQLSSQLLEWPYAWDIVSGKWTSEVKLNWTGNAAATAYSGTASQRVTGLAVQYKDVAFTGLNTTITTTIDPSAGVTFSPASLSVDLLDVGVPVRSINAEFALDVADKSVQVDKVSMSLLGGQLLADPFRFGLNEEERYDIVLRPKSIQLQFMLDLAEFRDIKLSGSISGVIPMAITGKTITVTDGRLESDPPGGVIRYLPGLDAGDGPLDLVSRALANFQFESLTSDVNYTENGDLKQQMRLTGINPDMDDRQPVILNLGVENNIPSMLKSLQAARSIEEILERNSAN